MGTKSQIQAGLEPCVAKAHDNEPLFVLRGTDPRAPELVRDWARQYYAMKIADRVPPHNGSQEETDLYMAEQARRMSKHSEALACAKRMDIYRVSYLDAKLDGQDEAQAQATAELAIATV